MAGRVTVLGIATLLAAAFLAKPSDPRMGRFQDGSAPRRRRRYKCQNCGYIVYRVHAENPPPPCNRCNGETKLIRRRRQG
jgi:rubrerythrin